MSRRVKLVFTLLVASVAAACAKKPEPAPPPAPAQAPVATAPRIDSSRIRDSLEQVRLAAEQQARFGAEAAAALAAAHSTLAAKIYFDFDKADLTAQARATLDAKLPILKANPALRIRIEGSSDKRGTDEYNLALGQRRAEAAQRYLTEHGIDAGRIDVTSYGEERSGDTGADYAQNRRADFVVVSGGDNLKVAPRR